MEDEEEERPMFGDLELRPDAGAVFSRDPPEGRTDVKDRKGL